MEQWYTLYVFIGSYNHNKLFTIAPIAPMGQLSELSLTLELLMEESRMFLRLYSK